MKNVFQEVPEKNHGGTANLVRLLQNLPCDQIVQTFNYAWIEPGKQLEEHSHKDCVEYFLFLSGIGVMTIGTEAFDVKKGDFVTVEMGVMHALENGGSVKLEFVTLRALIKDSSRRSIML